MTGRKVHGDNFCIGTAFELGPAGTAQCLYKGALYLFTFAWGHLYHL